MLFVSWLYFTMFWILFHRLFSDVPRHKQTNFYKKKISFLGGRGTGSRHCERITLGLSPRTSIPHPTSLNPPRMKNKPPCGKMTIRSPAVSKEPLSPKNDFVFKLLFGEPTRLNILKAFLQAVLDLPAEEYAHLVIVDPHLPRESPDDKLGVLDVKIHTTTGKVIDVEIQVKPHRHIWERILFYAARLTAERMKAGLSYKEIKKAVSIIILDEDITSKDSKHYHNCFRLLDEKTGYRFPDLFEINTLELPKLPVNLMGPCCSTG
jgi:hypothetical protein